MQTKILKDKVKILITDSGLGGLSVCAGLVNNIVTQRLFQAAEIIYFDAVPAQTYGYNLLPTTAEKTRVFDLALRGMQRFTPDIILIACNTLSVLYDRTPFSRETAIPVVDIIEFGVDMMHEHLMAAPASQLVIFGTPTTIEANTHYARLVERGIVAERIVTQACDRLAGQIENGPASATVATMIEDCVAQAVARLPQRNKPLLAALCCTHYPYSQALFEQSLTRHAQTPPTILNPNIAMSSCLTAPKQPDSAIPPSVTVRVVTKIRFSPEKVRAVADVLEPVSPLTATALRDYHQDPRLFAYTAEPFK